MKYCDTVVIIGVAGDQIRRPEESHPMSGSIRQFKGVEFGVVSPRGESEDEGSLSGGTSHGNPVGEI